MGVYLWSILLILLGAALLGASITAPVLAGVGAIILTLGLMFALATVLDGSMTRGRSF